ncbi:aminoacyl tRNA synthase complex-interacting multifunctional protein 1 [Episyrphus balteatus]|uniref:aminoacyl tRNA synthase complex-interacting multifunctional protein 1 n=1 Tax=Episyrphus balteatus TaxID=286459 RepID=UPI002485A6A8|nr:aminoacyl tRNA synthase complex-interacting multifunctional protein 1 [Episyrphus balteatus]
MSINRIVFSAIRKVKLLKNMSSVEIISKNNQQNENLINSLQQEFAAVQRELIARKKQQLLQENADLKKRITQTLSELIRLETQNGKKQIAIPGARSFCTQASDPPIAAAKPAAAAEETKTPPKEKKPKKEKPAKPAAAPNAAAAVELPIDVGRLDLRVGKIVEVGRHPDADSLYLEKIDCGEAQPRTVVSGLVKFVPLEEMQNRLVVVLCNLKPAKMRGVTSEAMVMCASTPDKVEVLSPPEGSVPGDLVHCEGYTRNPDAQLNPKKKVFETCAPDLKTNDDLVACFKGSALHVPGKGNVVAQTLKNVNVK